MGTQVGQFAERQAARQLLQQGYLIHQLNWRTRWCEIDIVASQQHVIYFVEVKYRRTSRQGRGLDYITPKKLRQMTFAADIWCRRHNWLGAYELAAIEVSGPNFVVGSLRMCN